MEDPDDATAIVSGLVAWLYTPGPQYSPRARRSAVEAKVCVVSPPPFSISFADGQSDHRIPVLYALGNSRAAAAIPHVIAHAHGTHDDDFFTPTSQRIRHSQWTSKRYSDTHTPFYCPAPSPLHLSPCLASSL
jgi:hypothetical protein